MTLRVEICRMADRVVRVYETSFAWDDSGVTGSSSYLWSDGNYGCDCNRALFFARAAGEEDPDDDESPCGDAAYRVRITEDGREVYRDDDYPSEEK